jgi:dTDP-4-amino-4,6-dideoxygalactose transaminase
MSKIPLVDLKAQYLSIKREIDASIQNVLENGIFIGGQIVKDFEDAFTKYIGVKYCISCGNGTDAIEILLQALGIGKGDEVIVPAISWVATATAVSNVGATPIFVDIDEFFTINPDLIEAKITPQTKAIIPVHLYGQPADMPKIMQIARKYQLKVIEDCAQAHGAEIDEKRAGTWGDAASFSFYPTKNLGAYGDAGAMLTDNIELAEKARCIGNYGQIKKHEHLIEGRNSRLDTLQAAILMTKLPHLNQWTQNRLINANLYQQLLKEVENISLPKLRKNVKHIFHLYVIRVQQRDALQKYLEANGIQTAIHYPKALPFLECYKNRSFQPADFPVAYQYQREILSLPMYAELTQEEVQYITETIKNWNR